MGGFMAGLTSGLAEGSEQTSSSNDNSSKPPKKISCLLSSVSPVALRICLQTRLPRSANFSPPSRKTLW